MLEAFTSRDFKPKTLKLIQQAQDLIDEYERDGIDLTLRALYYRLNSTLGNDVFPNNYRQYKNFCETMLNAREAGLVSWKAFVDVTRNLQPNGYGPGLESPREVFEDLAGQFWVDRHLGQEVYIEVWVEKDGQLGNIRRVCERWNVPSYSCRGYNSATEEYHAAKRFEEKAAEGLRCVLLYAGDHDPSGVNMTEDHRTRLAKYGGGVDVDVRRVLLNWDQIKEFNPPPAFAKPKDSRTEAYIEMFGTEDCWEMEAMEPRTIARVIEEVIKSLLDVDLYLAQLKKERRGKAYLRAIEDRWNEVAEFIAENIIPEHDDDVVDDGFDEDED